MAFISYAIAHDSNNTQYSFHVTSLTWPSQGLSQQFSSTGVIPP